MHEPPPPPPSHPPRDPDPAGAASAAAPRASEPTYVGSRAPGAWWRRALRWAGFFTSLGLLGGGALSWMVFVHFREDLPSLASLADYRPKLATRVYSADGRLIGEFGTERRILVPYERIPKRLIQAFISAEDKNFFEHGGIDYLGNVRAIAFRLLGRTARIGGTSTITQQLAKSLLISHEGFDKGTERTIRRKVREAILARRLEESLSKEDILWLYLNQVYLGHGAYGVQAAAEHYFRKDVYELALPEVALLAGLPQAPSRYSPLINEKAARQRVRTVLTRMMKNGFISQAERDAATRVDLLEIVHPRDDRFRDTAPYFTEHVRRYIYDTYGEKALYEGGLEIYTTLDLERQHHAEEAMVNGLREIDKRQGYRGPIAHIPDAATRNRAIAYIEKHQIQGRALEDNTPYLAVVTQVSRKHQWAEIRVGDIEGILPLAGVRWARDLNPNEYWENHLVRRIESVLKPGDVVLVTTTTEKELKAVPRSSEVLKLLPQKPAGEMRLLDKEGRRPVWDRPLFALDQIPDVEGALIAMNPHTGYVEAMIGGYAFEDSEFNRAFQACRQPGSAFKPIVYSAAVVREGYHPATMILDTPITVRDTDIGKTWRPQNFELSYKGEVTAREALMNSMNIPALHTMEKVGIREVIEFAHRMGIKTELKEELGTAIGSSCVTPWELTNVYTTWARLGLRPEPAFIKRVLDRDGRVLEAQASPNDPWQTHAQRLDSLYRLLEQPPARVLEQEDAYIVNYLLTQVATRGTAARASGLHKPVAGKTGTTNDSFDTWFVGYTPSLVTSVWVGYDTYAHPLATREQGGRTSLPIWLDFMKDALRGKKERDWEAPEGICTARIDGRTGRRTLEDTPQSFLAPFRCGQEPEFAAAGGGISLEDAVKQGGI